MPIDCNKMRQFFRFEPVELPQDIRLQCYQHLMSCQECKDFYNSSPKSDNLTIDEKNMLIKMVKSDINKFYAEMN